MITMDRRGTLTFLAVPQPPLLGSRCCLDQPNPRHLLCPKILMQRRNIPSKKSFGCAGAGEGYAGGTEDVAYAGGASGETSQQV
jgi:hypothetical protein